MENLGRPCDCWFHLCDFICVLLNWQRRGLLSWWPPSPLPLTLFLLFQGVYNLWGKGLVCDIPFKNECSKVAVCVSVSLFLCLSACLCLSFARYLPVSVSMSLWISFSASLSASLSLSFSPVFHTFGCEFLYLFQSSLRVSFSDDGSPRPWSMSIEEYN